MCRPEIIAFVLVATGCVSTQKAPFESTADTAHLEEKERRLWRESERMSEAIERSNQLYPDDELALYLQGVLDGLFPDFDGAVRITVVRAPVLNAFTLPDGSIYVHTGILARLENEAQLATVLAHEGIHFTHRHGFRQRAKVKGATAAATAVSLTGIPFVGELLAISSAFGFSRDLEREADRVGFERLVEAGYDPRESVRAFEHLLAQAEALDQEEPFFFASHPSLEERIENLQDLSAESPVKSGEVRAQVYTARTAGARVYALEEDLERLRWRSVLCALEDEPEAGRIPAHLAHYYAGECYRMRGQAGDAARSREAYRASLASEERYAPAHRALGRALAKAGEREEARAHLRRYLELNPSADDRAWIEQELQELNR